MKPISNFDEAKAYLEHFHDQSTTKYNLDNMLALMEHLGQPQEQFKAVHVAGTSGKTSTSYYMAALLTASGKKTGLTVSPHVTELNERLQVNGEPISEEEFCRALTEFASLLETAPVKPSWFEAMVAFAYWYFARSGVEYAVVEVGLGGLKDGTNVIQREDKVCIITDIGLDHLNVLGKNIAEIAAQKIGIAHKGNAVFTYRQSDKIVQVFKQATKPVGAELHLLAETSQRENFHDFTGSMPDFQKHNWLLAYKAYEYIANRDNLQHLTRQVLQETQQIIIPGRMDITHLNGKTVIMDGAHNAQKMTAFVGSFKQLYPGVKPAVLVALKRGKENQEIASILGPICNRLVTTTFRTSQDLPFRSMNIQVLANTFKPYVKDIRAEVDQNKALTDILNGPEEIIIITGSFYLLHQLRNNKLLE